MQPKTKKCRVCKESFKPFNSTQVVCNTKCAIEYAKTDKAKKELHKRQRAETRESRKALKSRADWLREAQAAFNAYIRQRDSIEPCISCGRHHTGQYHAGHYLSVGANPELRFNELNCHKQCVTCNNYRSGHIVRYRINLVKKIGQERLDWLEGPHELQKLTIEDITHVKSVYKAKLKELKQ